MVESSKFQPKLELLTNSLINFQVYTFICQDTGNANKLVQIANNSSAWAPINTSQYKSESGK